MCTDRICVSSKSTRKRSFSFCFAIFFPDFLLFMFHSAAIFPCKLVPCEVTYVHGTQCVWAVIPAKLIYDRKKKRFFCLSQFLFSLVCEYKGNAIKRAVGTKKNNKKTIKRIEIMMNNKRYWNTIYDTQEKHTVFCVCFAKKRSIHHWSVNKTVKAYKTAKRK